MKALVFMWAAFVFGTVAISGLFALLIDDWIAMIGSPVAIAVAGLGTLATHLWPDRYRFKYRHGR